MPKWRNWDRKPNPNTKFRYPKPGEHGYSTGCVIPMAGYVLYYWRCIDPRHIQQSIYDGSAIAGQDQARPGDVVRYSEIGFDRLFEYRATPFED